MLRLSEALKSGETVYPMPSMLTPDRVSVEARADMAARLEGV